MTKRFFALAIVVLAALVGAGNRVVNRGAPAGPTQIASDGFDYSNGTNLNTTGNWTAYSGSIAAWSSRAEANVANVSSYYYHTATFNANQYATATMANGEGDSRGITVRQQSGSESCYDLIYNHYDDQVQLRRINSGVTTNINTQAVTFPSGYKLWLEVTGTGSSTRLTAKHDIGSGWVTLWSNVDPGGTYIDGGKPGIFTYSQASGAGIDDWSAGNL